MCAVFWDAWLLLTAVPAWLVVLRVRCPGALGSCSPVRLLNVLCCVSGVLGHSAPVHWCARSVLCFACVVSWATWLLFTGVPARCVALHVRCPGPLGSRSPVCPRGVLCCVCGVLGNLAPVHRCARSVLCFACAVSWATWLRFIDMPARSVALRVRCPGPLGSCSPLCPLGVLCCVCGVLGHLAPVHRCARSALCFACAVSWATWLLFTGVPARCVALCVRCPGPLGSRSLVCPRGVLCSLCGVLGHLAPVHRCAHSVCCVACAVSWATCFLFTGVPLRWAVLRVRCPGPLGSRSPMCPRGLLCCVCGFLGRLTPVHRCGCSVSCVLCAMSWTTRLLFTGVPVGCVVLPVRFPRPLGSCSAMCSFRPLLCLCCVLGHVAPVQGCARSVRCFAVAGSWATSLPFSGMPSGCVVLWVRCPGQLAPVHRCARSVLCFGCAGSRAAWLLFTDVPAWCVALRVRGPGPLASHLPVCPRGVLCCACGVLGHLAPVHRCAHSVCCFGCAE